MNSDAFHQPAAQPGSENATMVSVLIADRLEILGPAISKIISRETDFKRCCHRT